MRPRKIALPSHCEIILKLTGHYGVNGLAEVLGVARQSIAYWTREETKEVFSVWLPKFAILYGELTGADPVQIIYDWHQQFGESDKSMNKSDVQELLTDLIRDSKWKEHYHMARLRNAFMGTFGHLHQFDLAWSGLAAAASQEALRHDFNKKMWDTHPIALYVGWNWRYRLLYERLCSAETQKAYSERILGELESRREEKRRFSLCICIPPDYEDKKKAFEHAATELSLGLESFITGLKEHVGFACRFDVYIGDQPEGTEPGFDWRVYASECDFDPGFVLVKPDYRLERLFMAAGENPDKAELIVDFQFPVLASNYQGKEPVLRRNIVREFKMNEPLYQPKIIVSLANAKPKELPALVSELVDDSKIELNKGWIHLIQTFLA